MKILWKYENRQNNTKNEEDENKRSVFEELGNPHGILRWFISYTLMDQPGSPSCHDESLL